MSNRGYIVVFLGLGAAMAMAALFGLLLVLPLEGQDGSAPVGWPTQTLPPIPTDVTGQPTDLPTATPLPTGAPPSSPTAVPDTDGENTVCVDRVTFVSDVTIPDGTVLRPNTPFTKTWRLRNGGSCTWTSSYELIFVGGSSMSGPSSQVLAAEVAPGENVELSVALIAPSSPGSYEGQWMLRNESGELFGLGQNSDRPFWVKIIAREPATATSIPPTRIPATNTPIPTVIPSATPAITEWRGEYFATRTLSGTPIVRNDSEINFNWGSGVPDSRIAADNFSVRWTRTLHFEQGLYRFTAAADDGIRVWVDDRLLIDAWRDSQLHTEAADYALARGNHTVRVEYYEHGGDASAAFSWRLLQPTSFPDWKGMYWSNRRLEGDPALVRNDEAINFGWGANGPAAGMPVDRFSARWTRTADFAAGTYRFHALVDDGVRIWLDNKLILDEWENGSARVEKVDVVVTKGNHSIKVEYFEDRGDASIKVWWVQTATPTPTLTPTNTPTATPTHTPTATVGLGSISGVVWHDLCAATGQTVPQEAGNPPSGCAAVSGLYRANGTLDTGETGIGNIIIALSPGSCSATPTLSAVTDADGAYNFEGLAAGTYCISISLTVTQNIDNLLPGLWTAPNSSASVLVTVGGEQEVVDQNFGWDYELLPIVEP